MSDFDPAFSFAMRHEDSGLTGVTTVDNNGARVRFGLNEQYNSDLGPLGYYEMPREQALEVAKTRYQRYYWEPANLSPIREQRIASKVFDFGVNAGVYRAVMILQLALGKTGQNVQTDGKCGEHTIMAVNSANPDTLLPWIATLAKDFHISLHEKNPQKYSDEDLKAWLVRDEEMPT